MAEANMVERLDSNQLVDMLSKKGLLVIGGDKNSAIFCPNKLTDVDGSRCIEHWQDQSTLLLWCAYICMYCIELCLAVVFLQTCRLHTSSSRAQNINLGKI